ncbi:unnamed protein product [Lampetra planeri]
MDEAALDSLAQEKLLQMAKELRVVLSLPSDSDNDGSSLQITKNIQVNLDLRDEPSAVPPLPLVVGIGADGGLPEWEPTSLTAAAAQPPLGPPRRSGTGGHGGPLTCWIIRRVATHAIHGRILHLTHPRHHTLLIPLRMMHRRMLYGVRWLIRFWELRRVRRM